MWKQISAFILLIAFSASSFCRVVIVLDYYSNVAAMAKNCVNKSKPSMHCNGKCQMMKKLQLEEKRNEGNAERKSENKQEVLSSKSFFDTPFVQKQATSSYFDRVMNDKPVDSNFPLLRPPGLVYSFF